MQRGPRSRSPHRWRTRAVNTATSDAVRNRAGRADGPGRYGRVAVLMGGTSAERAISLETGTAVCAALRRAGVDAHTVDVGAGFLREFSRAGFDRAFIALHGRGGEDGTVQGALTTLGVPFTGSGVLGSALAMDKVRSKWVWQSQGLPTPRFLEIGGEEDVRRIEAELGLPVMVKPVHEGSSCGASRVVDADGLVTAWHKARQLDARVLVEQWITGAEYTIGILTDRVLPVIKLETPNEFYDYDAKYVAETTRYICPCGLPGTLQQELGRIALRAFQLVGAAGWGRVDLMLDERRRPWLLEVNTVPGMTSHSLVPMAARHAGMEFDDLVLRILDTSFSAAETGVARGAGQP
ncbi:MAG: D-alanine--D-alanine ligase [Gammaproteobacteria bacterium]|nr:D-alanine--D-alanine ligase [Gammaproteobacteria bacterium]